MTWRLLLRSAQHSDATRLSLKSGLRAQDVAPRPGRNLAYLDDEARIERRQGAWTLGLLARSRATLVASEDSLQLYRQVDDRAAVGADRRFGVDARLRGFSGSGALLGRRHGLGGAWTAAWEVQALVLRRWRERRISGSADAFAVDGSYGFALYSVQQDDSLDFSFQAAYPARGAALLGGLRLAWQGERWQMQLQLRDAGWLRWRGLPRQDAVLDSRTASFDADGYLIYRPLVQGQNTQATARARAPAFVQLQAAWALSAVSTSAAELTAGADLLPGFGPLPWLGLRLPLAGARLALQWRTHEQRLHLQWEWRGLLLTAGADRLGSRARSRELGLGWCLPL